MGDPIDLEEQSNASFSSASHTKPQSKAGAKRKSIYWSHFEDIINPTTKKIEKVKCKYCGKVLSANPNSGTSTLRKHIQSCNKYPHNVYQKQKKIPWLKIHTLRVLLFLIGHMMRRLLGLL